MRLTPVNGWRPAHLSYSAIDRFDSCPRKYYDSYVEGKKFPATRPMVMGTLFSNSIEALHNGLDVSVHAEFLKLREPERNLLSLEDVDTVKRWVELYRTSGGCPYVGVPEFEFLTYLPDRTAVPVPIKGYMDLRETDAPVVHEFKTTGRASHESWGWNQHRVDTSEQAAIYWYADGRDPLVRFTVMHHRNGGISMSEYETRPSMATVLKVQDKAGRLWAALGSGDFACTCGRCLGSRDK